MNKQELITAIFERYIGFHEAWKRRLREWEEAVALSNVEAQCVAYLQCEHLEKKMSDIHDNVCEMFGWSSDEFQKGVTDQYACA